MATVECYHAQIALHLAVRLWNWHAANGFEFYLIGSDAVLVHFEAEEVDCGFREFRFLNW